MKRLTIYRDGALEINCENCPETKICKSAELTESDCLYFLTERLAEYEDAEEQGLLVRLPCKLGIDAYFVNEATEEVCEAVVTNIELNYYTPSRVWLDVSYVSKLIGKQSYYHCADKLIGKKLFFTREEAEKSLEGMKNEA